MNSIERLKLEITTKGRLTKNQLRSDLIRRLVSNPPGLCAIDTQLSYLRVCHAQSCGKCVPCRVGLGKLVELLQAVLDNKASMKTMELIKTTAQSIADSADCAIGTEAARMVLTGLEGFQKEYISHIQKGKCSNGVRHAIPCIAMCPARVDIPGYVALVGAGRYEDAVKLIRQDNPFPTACALICEHPCEVRCRRNIVDAPINIRGLKRKAVDEAPADKVPVPEKAESTGKKVAIVGGGPSGLTCAYYLELMGHHAVVFESKSKLGGMLRYGIPNYRFPRVRLDEDINAVLSTGVEVHLKQRIGKKEGEISLEQLTKDYDAVYIAIGAHTDKKLGIEGENSKGVMSAVQMLRAIGDDNMPDFKDKNVIVIGGGNVAMDCCRSAIRLGAKKTIIAYRRRQEDMPALSEEVEGAIAEGLELYTLKSPHHIEADENGNVTALWAEPQIIGPIDERGRTRTLHKDVPLERIPADIIVVAIGQNIETTAFAESGVTVQRGAISAMDTGKLSDHEGIFAGGDCVTGPATVIRAIAAGKVAASNIDDYLGYNHTIGCDIELPEPAIDYKNPCGRIELEFENPTERKGNFEPIECGMTDQEAKQEASRCLRCDCYGLSSLKGGRRVRW